MGDPLDLVYLRQSTLKREPKYATMMDGKLENMYGGPRAFTVESNCATIPWRRKNHLLLGIRPLVLLNVSF